MPLIANNVLPLLTHNVKLVVVVTVSYMAKLETLVVVSLIHYPLKTSRVTGVSVKAVVNDYTAVNGLPPFDCDWLKVKWVILLPVRHLVALDGLHRSNIRHYVLVKPDPHLLRFVPKWHLLNRDHYRRKLCVGLRPFIKYSPTAYAAFAE